MTDSLREWHASANNSRTHGSARWTMPCCFTTCVPSDRLCSAFREQIGERHAGTRVLRRGGSNKRRGQHQPLLRRRRRRRRKSRRGWKHCSVPCAFLRVPPRFFPFPHISYTGAPCGTFYLPKATSNAPARAQVCPIVSRPIYRVPRPRVWGFALFIMYLAIITREKKERKGVQERAQNVNIHAWIHESGWRIKWHCDVFRHSVVRAICWRNLM